MLKLSRIRGVFGGLRSSKVFEKALAERYVPGSANTGATGLGFGEVAPLVKDGAFSPRLWQQNARVAGIIKAHIDSLTGEGISLPSPGSSQEIEASSVKKKRKKKMNKHKHRKLRRRDRHSTKRK